MVDSKIFGANLRLLRESLGMTRQTFAARFDVSAYTLQGYETGMRCPNFKRFLQICNSIPVSPNVLLAGLYPWPTELDDLQELAFVMDGLDEVVAQRIRGAQEIFIQSSPRMHGASFGARLHLLRVDARMETTVLAERCLVARSTLQGYESGQYDPSIPVVLRLCEALGISPAYLLAPELEQSLYPYAQVADLRPGQIKGLLKITRYLANCF